MIPNSMEAVITPEMTAEERKIAFKENKMENELCSLVGKELEKHYPGWSWYVECRMRTGLVAVRNTDLDGNYGFYIPIREVITETMPRLVMLAGGEILERYRLDRGAMPNELDIERDFVGHAIGDTDATS